MASLRVEVDGGVRAVTLDRPDEYNTITPALRDELDAAIDDAERDDATRVVLLRAEGPAFCAGYGLDWATAAPPSDGDGAGAAPPARSWDSNADLLMISRFARTWLRLHTMTKPVVAAVQGWCIAGGMNIVLNADVIVAAESARFGYPPARVWGIPEHPWQWIARMGLERAKRYMLTGDELSGREAAEAGLVLECVPDAELDGRARWLAARMAALPLNQLQMIKRVLNETARHLYDPEGSMTLACLFDGVARNTDEGRAFVERSRAVGFRQAVRERDDPFGDYGSRPR